jgi:hypothetical protein
MAWSTVPITTCRAASRTTRRWRPCSDAAWRWRRISALPQRPNCAPHSFRCLVHSAVLRFRAARRRGRGGTHRKRLAVLRRTPMRWGGTLNLARILHLGMIVRWVIVIGMAIVPPTSATGSLEFGFPHVALAAVVPGLEGRPARAVTATARGLARLRGFVHSRLPLQGRFSIGTEEAVMTGIAFAMNPRDMQGVIENNVAGPGWEDQLPGRTGHLALGGGAGNKGQDQKQTTDRHR